MMSVVKHDKEYIRIIYSVPTLLSSHPHISSMNIDLSSASSCLELDNVRSLLLWLSVHDHCIIFISKSVLCWSLLIPSISCCCLIDQKLLALIISASSCLEQVNVRSLPPQLSAIDHHITFIGKIVLCWPLLILSIPWCCLSGQWLSRLVIDVHSAQS